MVTNAALAAAVAAAGYEADLEAALVMPITASRGLLWRPLSR